MAKLLSGVTSIAIDGTIYDVSGNVKFELSAVEREAKMSMSGNLNYSEKPVEGSISFDGYITSDIDPTIFAGMTDVNVVVGNANGMQLVGNDMFQTEKLEYDMMEGTMSLKFSGPQVTVITA